MEETLDLPFRDLNRNSQAREETLSLSPRIRVLTVSTRGSSRYEGVCRIQRLLQIGSNQPVGSSSLRRAHQQVDLLLLLKALQAFSIEPWVATPCQAVVWPCRTTTTIKATPTATTASSPLSTSDNRRPAGREVGFRDLRTSPI